LGLFGRIFDLPLDQRSLLLRLRIGLLEPMLVNHHVVLRRVYFAHFLLSLVADRFLSSYHHVGGPVTISQGSRQLVFVIPGLSSNFSLRSLN